MPSARKLFSLTLFALWGTTAQCKSIRGEPDDTCAFSPKSIVSDACVSYQTLQALNDKVKPVIDELTKETDFFSYYRLNLYNKKCPFWNDDNGICGNIACAVDTIDNKEDIPKIWRASELGKLEGPSAKHPGKKVQIEKPQRPLQGSLGENVGESCVVEYDDECDERDYCVPEDETASTKGDYVSLVHNPERFTGFAGEGAKMVWDAIYRENCFQKSSFPRSAALGMRSVLPGPAAQDFRNVLHSAERQQIYKQHHEDPNKSFAQTSLENEDECLEKRVFYRVVSGMHSSISTHLCWDFLNQTTGEWQPNLKCYTDRLHHHPERISNLYFNYALLTRAIAKLGPYLQTYTFCTGEPDQDASTKAKVLAVTEASSSIPQIFDESLMFKNGEGPSLKEDFRNRFRNVSRIMDCVGCDKCRLWGKVQTSGYGTALKVLFETDNDRGEVPKLKRTELVALFNTYARLSSSLEAQQRFRAMIEEAGVEADARVVSSTLDQVQTPDVDVISSESSKVVPPEPSKEAPSETSKKVPSAVPIETPFEEPKAIHSTKLESEARDAGSERDIGDSGRNDFGENFDSEEQSELTTEDLFWEELNRANKAMKLVLRGWIRFPGILFSIVIFELNRFWEFYIGLPVTPRTWHLERPSMDEL